MRLIARLPLPVLVLVYVMGAVWLLRADSLQDTALGMLLMGLAAWAIVKVMSADKRFREKQLSILLDDPVREMREIEIAKTRARWNTARGNE